VAWGSRNSPQQCQFTLAPRVCLCAVRRLCQSRVRHYWQPLFGCPWSHESHGRPTTQSFGSEHQAGAGSSPKATGRSHHICKQRCAAPLGIDVTPTTNGDDSACGTIWLPLSLTLVTAKVVSKHARCHSEPSQVFAERSSCSPRRLPGKRAVLQRPSLSPAATTSRL
jgi:hypothetical protein